IFENYDDCLRSENQKMSKELSTGLRNPSELADSTSEFRPRHLSALNIHYGDRAIGMFGDMPSFSYSNSLLLRNANKDQLFGAWADDSLTEGWNNKERTLARYISNVLMKEIASAGRHERVTNSFKSNLFVIVDEDKHLNNVSKLTWWGECQIAGELLASAFVNHEVLRGRYRVQSLFAIHVVGTQFTFYRAEVDFNYLNSLVDGFSAKEMCIYRYPVDQGTDQFPCLDYMDPDQRKEILDILIKIKNFVIQDKTVS
ncbi:21135_t:CDS:2, partial [Dentiscutata erythropus]